VLKTNSHSMQKSNINSHVVIPDSEDEKRRPSKLKSLCQNIGAVSPSTEYNLIFPVPDVRESHRCNAGKWWDWLKDISSSREKVHEEVEEVNDPEYKEIIREGGGLYFEGEMLLQARKAENEIRQPGIKINGWIGKILGAGLLIGGISATTYYSSRGHRHNRGDARDNAMKLGPGEDITLEPEAEILTDVYSGPRAEKLQDKRKIIPISLTTPMQEATCDLKEDLDTCEEAYKFRKEAGLEISTKLTINEGVARCICPSESLAKSTVSNVPEIGMLWNNTRQPLPALQIPIPRCEFEEDFKNCEAVYSFRKKVGLAPTTKLTLSNESRKCICPPEITKIKTTTEKSREDLENRLINLTILSDFDKLEKSHSVPEAINNLIIKKQMDRAFYNRYFYPILMQSSDNLKKNNVTVNEGNFIRELINIILSTLKNLEEISIAHALKIDPIYNQFIIIVREIGRDKGVNIDFISNEQQVNASWIIKKLGEVSSKTELDQLQKECIDLTVFYSDPENIRTETFISGRLEIIIRNITLLFEQSAKKLASKDNGNYIADYLSTVLFNLDRNACNKIRTDTHSNKICSLYPDIGFSLFKLRSLKFRKVAAILIAERIFIPRLREILNASHLYIDSREFRLIEKVLCSFSGVVDPLFCGSDALLDNIKENNNSPNENITRTEAPEDVLEKYISVPVPFYGIGAGAGVVGAGFVAGAGILAHAAGSAKTDGRSDANTNFETSTNVDTHTDVVSDASVDTNASGMQQAGDLVCFPEIPAPPGDNQNEIVILNSVAKREFKGKDFIITRGITSDVSGEVPEYIRQTQVIARPHIRYASELVSSLRQTLSTRANDPEFLNYLREYFCGALNINDQKILDMAIERFTIIVGRVQDFFYQSLRQSYRNIFIMSTRQIQNSFEGEFSSLLTEEELREVPNAVSYFSNNPSIAIVTDSSYLVNPMHIDPYRRTLTHDLTDTLLHEATHAAINSRDYFYLPRTATGRSTNARDAFLNIRTSLESMGVESDLQGAILSFIRERNIPYPDNIITFLNKYPVFRSYLLMNSAEHLETFIRDIARGVNFDAPPPL